MNTGNALKSEEPQQSGENENANDAYLCMNPLGYHLIKINSYQGHSRNFSPELASSALNVWKQADSITLRNVPSKNIMSLPPPARGALYLKNFLPILRLRLVIFFVLSRD